jgi:hypothetical protein
VNFALRTHHRRESRDWPGRAMSAMRRGHCGNCGIIGGLESATCRQANPGKDTNPPSPPGLPMVRGDASPWFGICWNTGLPLGQL